MMITGNLETVLVKGDEGNITVGDYIRKVLDDPRAYKSIKSRVTRTDMIDHPHGIDRELWRKLL